jgi:hypothetical protein
MRPHHSLTLEAQALELGRIGGTGIIMPERRLLWQCRLRPSPISREYSLLLSYQPRGPRPLPRTFVMSPDLRALTAGYAIPHVYLDECVEMCLFYPRSSQWHTGMSLADTVVPWALMWLLYFEDWLATGVWAGGGIHEVPPVPSPTRTRLRRLRTVRATKNNGRQLPQSLASTISVSSAAVERRDDV